ncbi:MAG TPA: cytochrome c biogenesis protein CcdA [Candidatus Baltobacteraceae bacterium]|nr:cytochrome c biogenesis protein CcdA [Candidatus Baltobacteraceae bacterium]
MMDLVRATIEASSHRSLEAPLIAMAAGLASSFGPCIAPRFVTLAALTADGSPFQRRTRVASFVGGLCACYVLMGSVAGALGYVAATSHYVYAMLASIFIVAGLFVLTRPTRHACSVKTTHVGNTSAGAAAIAGFGCGLVASPCCGPIAAIVGGIGVATGSVNYGALILGSFALGHAIPLFAGAGVIRFVRSTGGTIAATAAPVVSGALLLALGSYYALLA